MKYFRLTGHKSFITSVSFYEEPENLLLRVIAGSLDSFISITDI